MRYYIAASIEPDSKAMNYKEIGNEADLGLKFPEIDEFIKRYSFKSVGMTFVNGDRLRIYGVKNTEANMVLES